MYGVRTVARPLLASMFVVGGVNTLRRSSDLVPVAEDVTDAFSDQTGIEASTQTLVKINGGVQLVGGAMLAAGVLPRWAALALAGTIVPTTLAAHRFWEEEGDARAQQVIEFCKNAGLLGGLLFAALDHGGRPSVFWATRRAAGDAAEAVGASANRTYGAVTAS